MSFLAALQFLTIIPVPRRYEASPDDLSKSISYFPVVGIVIGLLLAGLGWLLDLVLPSAVANILLIALLAAITGALHLDGLADTCDGLAGGKTPEERWRMMKESRVGSYGVIGICLILLAKYVSLNSVPHNLVPTTLVLMPVASRWAMAYAIVAYPYAKPSGLGKVFKQGADWLKFVMPTLMTLAVAAALFQLVGLAIMLAMWIIVLIAAAFLKSKFAGLTGDNYGAINEIVEVSVLILVCLFARVGILK